MIDPLTSLAFSMHSMKGIYALLLGSGVSRSAQIPTGWEITLDLVRRLAELEGDDPGSTIGQWYTDKFEEEPNYSKLLEMLFKTRTERTSFLREKFEPTEDELEKGIKIPTLAHRSIANLIKKGYFRVILTTNFDRLLENALHDVGIEPTVISNADEAKGAIPLIHSRITIVKLNGDYLDTRIKNSASELSRYPKLINELLDRILDEFGLIICGWSGEWDTALRKAILRAPNRRFSMYWAQKDSISSTAHGIINHRSAETINISDADVFFESLSEKVLSLENISSRHPVSIEISIEQTKKYVSERKYLYKLHDLVMEETERLFRNLSEESYPIDKELSSYDEISNRMSRYEDVSMMILNVLATGCYWCSKEHNWIWVKSIERITPRPIVNKTGLAVWLNLRFYPALMVLYSGGISSVAVKNYNTLASLLSDIMYEQGGKLSHLLLRLYPGEVLNVGLARKIPGMERHQVPLSFHLFKILRNPLKIYLADEINYERSFDKFEYLMGLVHADYRQKQGDEFWGPVGCFGWRARRLYLSGDLSTEVKIEAEQWGNDWQLLKSGLFDESIDRFLEVKKNYDALVLRTRNEGHFY